jgi:two-component system cell cycle response regulator DivK
MQNETPVLLKKVLIAEDNPDLREIFARTFHHYHFSVEVAEDGIETIESLKLELPDVLILDVNMPRLSGFDVLRYVRQNQRTKDIKVVVVTGNCMAMQAPEAEYADLLLVKPVSIKDLVTLAQRLTPTEL